MRYVIHLRNPIQFRFSDCNCLQLLSALVLALLFHFVKPNDLSCLIILNVMFHAIALLVILLFAHSIICDFVDVDESNFFSRFFVANGYCEYRNDDIHTMIASYNHCWPFIVEFCLKYGLIIHTNISVYGSCVFMSSAHHGFLNKLWAHHSEMYRH